MGFRRNDWISEARGEVLGTGMFPESLPPGWKKKLGAALEKDSFKSLQRFLKSEYAAGAKVFPAKENIFRALQSLDIGKVKVVILGQDPYHGEGQAIGLSFAVPNALRLKPPSLQNIFKEIRSDLGVELPDGQSDLSAWVAEGVLLLNSVLTVRAGEAFSHREQGWESFTDEVIRVLDEEPASIVFLLWGAAALKKKALITNSHHFVLESPHPSPLSAHRGFLGNRHFSKANTLLREAGRGEVRWEKISI